MSVINGMLEQIVRKKTLVNSMQKKCFCNFLLGFILAEHLLFLFVFHQNVQVFFVLLSSAPKVLPLYHLISGCGVPDAEQAITVVSPVPMRISLRATVTTGDSREG